MQYIQELLDLTQNYWVLATIIGLLSAFIESFIPALPLVAIVTANAAIQGLFIGCLLSWIGSGLGTTSLFLLISRFNDSKLFNKLRNSKTEKAISWMDKQGFKLLFIAYACPFMPGCLVTIASAFGKKDLKDFVPAMLAGKFVMFIVISYVLTQFLIHFRRWSCTSAIVLFTVLPAQTAAFFDIPQWKVRKIIQIQLTPQPY